MKKIVALSLVLIMVFTLAGCDKLGKVVEVLTEDEEVVNVDNEKPNNEVEVKDDTDVNKEPDNADLGNVETENTFLTLVYDESGTSEADIALAFLRYIRNGEYDKVIPLMIDSGAKFISGEEIYDVLLKSSSTYLDITDKDALVETKILKMDDGRGAVRVTLKTTDTNFDNVLYECTVPIKLNEDNLWRINLINDLAVQNLGIIIPKNCTLFVDGIEVNRDSDVTIRPYEGDIELEVWEFEHIGMSEKQITVKSAVYEVTTAVTPEKDNRTVQPILPVADDLTAQANEFAKTVFVELLNAACEETITLEQVEKYVSVNAPKGTAGNIVNSYMKESENYASRKYTNVEVSQVIPHPTTENNWYTDDCMLVTLGMSVSWEDPGFTKTSKVTTEVMDKYFTVKLEYQNGEFKIIDSDTDLFSDIVLLNGTTDDF